MIQKIWIAEGAHHCFIVSYINTDDITPQFWDLSAVAITARLSFETEGMLFRYPSLPFVETPLVLFVFPVLFGPVYSWHKRLLLTPLQINGDQCWAEGKLKYEEVETSGQ